jgi:hypothetical protein
MSFVGNEFDLFVVELDTGRCRNILQVTIDVARTFVEITYRLTRQSSQAARSSIHQMLGRFSF